MPPAPYVPTMNANRPTCKVVMGGQGDAGRGRGARIYPRGCKVRAVGRGGGTTKYSKTGHIKIKRREPQASHDVQVRFGNPAAGLQGHALMTYDTGAMITTLTQGTAQMLGIGSGNGKGVFDRVAQVNGVGGLVNTNVYRDVQMVLAATGERMDGEVRVGTTMNLLGVSQLKQLKRYKVRFT